jgi:hypothetical protein
MMQKHEDDIPFPVILAIAIIMVLGLVYILGPMIAAIDPLIK